MSGWRHAVLRLMRVPHEPSPPPGSPPRIFRASRNYFVLRTILWVVSNLALITVLIWLFIIIAYYLPPDAPPAASRILGAAIGFVTAILLVRLTLGYAVMRLDYELRWYMISDRAIRIREGIVTVKEKTIALANVQNTVINQGPLQRLLGIADVEVRTAGGGSASPGKKGEQMAEPMHIGYFRGVDNAPQLREIILEGVRRHRDTGLGDPEDPVAAVLHEARLLRAFLESVAAPSS
jgi:membrane protein YdbS with pleckstrin-like domain